MNKITKIIIFTYPFFLIDVVHADVKPPFKNMIVNKHPIEHKNILFKDFDGNNVNLKDQKSKIYMLNFWATWCLPCKQEMPYLDNLQNVNGIKIFPINIEKNNKLETKIFFKSLEIKNLSIYFDIETNLVNSFRLRGIPTTIILNKDRKEIARVIGAVDFSNQSFIDWINNVSD